MDCAIRDFIFKIKDRDCILVYFSGHGMEENVRTMKYLLRLSKTSAVFGELLQEKISWQAYY
jgi:uncharacterized caspase-like protein